MGQCAPLGPGSAQVLASLILTVPKRGRHAHRKVASPEVDTIACAGMLSAMLARQCAQHWHVAEPICDEPTDKRRSPHHPEL